MVNCENISERQYRKLKLEKTLKRNRVVVNRLTKNASKTSKNPVPSIEFD